MYIYARKLLYCLFASCLWTLGLNLFERPYQTFFYGRVPILVLHLLYFATVAWCSIVCYWKLISTDTKSKQNRLLSGRVYSKEGVARSLPPPPPSFFPGLSFFFFFPPYTYTHFVRTLNWLTDWVSAYELNRTEHKRKMRHEDAKRASL